VKILEGRTNLQNSAIGYAQSLIAGECGDVDALYRDALRFAAEVLEELKLPGESMLLALAERYDTASKKDRW
jgi:hypothetical protein